MRSHFQQVNIWSANHKKIKQKYTCNNSEKNKSLMIYFQFKSINFDFRNLVYKVKWCKVAESVEIFKKKTIRVQMLAQVITKGVL